VEGMLEQGIASVQGQTNSPIPRQRHVGNSEDFAKKKMVRHKPQGRMSMFPHLYFILFYTFSSFLPIWPFEQLTLYLPAVFSSGEQKVVFMFRLQSGKSRPSLITTAQDI
jgi:hypothetical protein